MRPTLPWVRAFVAAPLAACLLAGCGASFAPDASSGGGKNARPLAANYDIMVTVPALVLPQFPATGL
ncbi:MAG TPA: hypothetical protein VFP98_02855, partial [Candidatus Polarisedimenticolia bacterium]|nr:hypothetical protein [Candidatus Polarisedimenticolia bacterium]